MNRDEILHQLDAERRSLVYDDSVLDILPHLTRFRTRDRAQHSVIYSQLAADNADIAIRNEIGHHGNLGVPFEWKLYTHDSPPDLIDRLRRNGFSIGPREVVLVYDLAQPAEWIHEQSVRVERIEGIEQLDTYRRLAEEIFHKNYEFTYRQLATGIKAGSTQHRAYIAWDGDTAASIGRLYTHPESHFAGLYGGGTLPAHRGKHLYRAAVAARARDAIAAGARYLQVDALPTSRPILERLGFQWVGDTYPCEWSPKE